MLDTFLWYHYLVKGYGYFIFYFMVGLRAIYVLPPHGAWVPEASGGREADVERRLDATELLRRELREMKTVIQSLVSSVSSASTSQQGAQHVASTSRLGAAPPGTSTVSSGLPAGET